MKFHRFLGSLTASGALILIVGVALAETASLTVGPIAAPPSGSLFCLDDECFRLPIGTTSVMLQVTVDTGDNSVTSTLEPVDCPAGQSGQGIVVTAGEETTGSVTATMTGVGPRGPYSQTLSTGTIELSQTHQVMASVCGL